MPCKPYILNTYFFMLTACHPEQHARCFDRFCKKAVDIRSEQLLKSISDTSRSSANSARQIEEQRMSCIHGNTPLYQLYRDAHCSRSVSEEKIFRVLIIYEKAVRISFRLLPSVGNSLAVIPGILPDNDAFAPEQILLPLFCIT